MSEKIVNIYHNYSEKSIKIKNNLIDKFTKKGFLISENFNPDAILNICIGGDGSFINAVHASKGSSAPFIGINTGHLGFYQEILVSEIDRFIEDFINDKYIINKLSMLGCEIHYDGGVISADAINEFVIRSTKASIIHLDILIDSYHLEHFAGDGLIVSTPSGSTAYSFSVGGAVLYQELKGFQMSPIAPINSRAYRSLINSVVMPDTAVLEARPLDLEEDTLQLVQDGIVIDLPGISRLKFTYGTRFVNKIVFDPKWYWINIKDKFL